MTAWAMRGPKCRNEDSGLLCGIPHPLACSFGTIYNKGGYVTVGSLSSLAEKILLQLQKLCKKHLSA